MTLGKRKRRNDDASTVSSTKSQKKSPKSHAYNRSYCVEDPPVSISTLPQSSPAFPFFLLPAELRNQIWYHLYENLSINVSLKSHNKLASASHQDLLYTLVEKRTDQYYEEPFRLPPRLCKQFYAEATAALYSNCTFSFNSPHVFRAFALSNHACVSKVQHITIPRLTKHWIDSLVCSLVGRLTSLRGVHLTWQYLRNPFNAPLPNADNWAWRDYWIMIRAFQQHELEKGRTRAELAVMNAYKSIWAGRAYTLKRVEPGMEQFEDIVELQKVFTEGLLEFTPRRVSRRGTRG